MSRSFSHCNMLFLTWIFYLKFIPTSDCSLRIDYKHSCYNSWKHHIRSLLTKTSKQLIAVNNWNRVQRFGCLGIAGAMSSTPQYHWRPVKFDSRSVNTQSFSKWNCMQSCNMRQTTTSNLNEISGSIFSQKCNT